MQQGSWLGHIYLLELLTTPNSVAVFVLLGYSPPFPVPKAWAVAANVYGRHNGCPKQHKGEERITFKELSSIPSSYSCYSPSHLPSYMYTNSRSFHSLQEFLTCGLFICFGFSQFWNPPLLPDSIYSPGLNFLKRCQHSVLHCILAGHLICTLYDHRLYTWAVLLDDLQS